MSGPYRLAVDFGTSNTAAAVAYQDDQIRVLRLGHRSDTMPSSASLYEGRLTVGEEAVRLAGLDPSAFEPAPKRRLGESSIILGQSHVDPIDLVAAVLARVHQTALQQANGQIPESIILTHPAAWRDFMLSRLWEAANRAGMQAGALQFATEPVSAGWHYAANSRLTPGERLAVVDFGGGTCDAALLDFRGPQFKEAAFSVVAVSGIDPLGGDDFDDLLFRWVLDQLRRDGRGEMVDHLLSPEGIAARLTLRDQAREAKHALSMMPRAPIPVTAAGQNTVVTVTRDEFEELLQPDLDRATVMTEELLHSNEAPSGQATELSQLFLTGGSSLIPLVQRKFQHLTGGRVGRLGDPKQITCVGALQAPDPRRASPPAVPPKKPAPPNGPGIKTVGTGTPSKRGLLIGAGSVVAVLLIGLVVWAMAGPPENDETGGSGSSSSSPGGITPTPTPTPTPRPTPTPTPTPTICQGAETDAECSMLSAMPAKWVDLASCVPSDDNKALHSMRCEPRNAEKLGDKPNLYLYRFDTTAELKESAKKQLSTYELKSEGTDVTKPPAQDTWHYVTDESDIQGDLISYSIDGYSYLIWTFNEERIWAALSVPDGDPAAMFEWWKDPAAE